MKLLLEIKDNQNIDTSSFRVRKAVRAIVTDEQGRLPILFVAKHNYHKLPGGGMKEGETRMDALAREMLEETGCQIEVEGEVGKIVEYRTKHQLKQISYCYYGKVLRVGETKFTKKEIDHGFILMWMTFEEAISKLKEENPTYNGKFICKRDLKMLTERKKDFKI